MRHVGKTALLAVFALGACRPAAPPPAAELDAETQAAIAGEVRAAVDGLFEAMNAHDADRILEHYTDAEDLMYVGALSPEFGRGRLETMVRTWATGRANMTVTYQLIHVQVLSPTVATAFTQGQFSNSETGTVWTHVLVREDDGRWRIMLEHEVWPESGQTQARGPHPM